MSEIRKSSSGPCKQDSDRRGIFYLRYQPYPPLTRVTMRRILFTLAILILFVIGLSALWIFRGRQVSLFIDRFRTIEISSAQISAIAYEGSGSGGVLIANDLRLSLNDPTLPWRVLGRFSLSDRWLPRVKMLAIVSQLHRRRETMLLSQSVEALLVGRRHSISIS